MNRLIAVKGDTVSFTVEHTVNGSEYTLSTGDRYYFNVASPGAPEKVLMSAYSDSAQLLFVAGLPVGSYVFELGVVSSSGTRSAVLPALDERGRALNELIVLKRLGA